MWVLQPSGQKHVPTRRTNSRTSVRLACWHDPLPGGSLAGFSTPAPRPLHPPKRAVSPLAPGLGLRARAWVPVQGWPGAARKCLSHLVLGRTEPSSGRERAQRLGSQRTQIQSLVPPPGASPAAPAWPCLSAEGGTAALGTVGSTGGDVRAPGGPGEPGGLWRGCPALVRPRRARPAASVAGQPRALPPHACERW